MKEYYQELNPFKEVFKVAFSERTKKVAKQKANFRCVICYKPFVEVHHIIPQAEGGDDSLDNAAPLCASCHDLFGGNPEKRKQIKQMRDHWFEQMGRRNSGEINVLGPINEEPDNINMLKEKGLAIYHVVYEHEDFKTTVEILMSLLNRAQKDSPNQKRFLYLDIEGHRNSAGGFDHDMFELQKDFMLGFFLQFFTDISMPLIRVKNINLQNNDMPGRLNIFS
ncbi:HNH endonuclease [Brevibacillus halotolerans]|uniref:HNH endonuclease n=1 Tax=Brevibacillus halotolerans TaxID=1507437 RepID=UPI001C689ECB